MTYHYGKGGLFDLDEFERDVNRLDGPKDWNQPDHSYKNDNHDDHVDNRDNVQPIDESKRK